MLVFAFEVNCVVLMFDTEFKILVDFHQHRLGGSIDLWTDTVGGQTYKSHCVAPIMLVYRRILDSLCLSD